MPLASCDDWPMVVIIQQWLVDVVRNTIGAPELHHNHPMICAAMAIYMIVEVVEFELLVVVYNWTRQAKDTTVTTARVR